jgi:hypothetical protein
MAYVPPHKRGKSIAGETRTTLGNGRDFVTSSSLHTMCKPWVQLHSLAVIPDTEHGGTACRSSHAVCGNGALTSWC